MEQNGVSLSKVAEANETSKVIFGSFGERARAARGGKTNLDALYVSLERQVKHLDKEAFLNTFRQLEKLGAGAIVFGRRGNPDRFVWNYSLRDVAQAAKDGDQLEEYAPIRNTPAPSRKPSKPAKKVLQQRAPRKPKTAEEKVALKTKAGTTITISIHPTVPAEQLTALLQLAAEINQQNP